MKYPQWTQNAVLIYGPRKSGTSLLQNLLDGTPQLLVRPGELKFKFLNNQIFSSKKNLQEQYNKINYILKLNNNFKIPNFSIQKYEKHLKSYDYPNDLKEQIIQDIMAVYHSINKDHRPDISQIKIWASKEAGGNAKDVIKIFKMCFPEGKLILIIRNPLSITRAVIMDRRRINRKLGIIKLKKETFDPLKVLLAQINFLKNPSAFLVTYEDLVDSPKREIYKICKFLDINYDEVLLRPTIFGTSVVVATSSEQVKKVFKKKKPWYEGLTIREIVLCVIFYMLFQIYHYYKKKSFMNYKKASNLIRSKFCKNDNESLK